jgi:membrane-associated phospholipid phosphatase
MLLKLISNSKSHFIVAFILVNVVMNVFYRTALFQFGENLIFWMQTFSNPVLDRFFTTVTLIIDPSVVVLASCMFVMIRKDKRNAIISLVFVLINIYLTGVLKALYADPRPFWANSTIRNIGIYCPQEYGNPSGHSWFAPVISFAFILEYFDTGKNRINLIISMFILFFVPLSRMYLGAHSLNQILQGLCLGLSFVYLYKFSSLKSKI